MKNIIHTVTHAQMRANPRRTLVTLAGVVLSVTMLTAVFAGADSFLNLFYRQATQDHGTWQGRAFETGEPVVQALLQDDRVDQLGLAANRGVAPLDGSHGGTSLYAVNEAFYGLLNVECLEGTLPTQSNELAVPQMLAEKTGWKPGDQVTLDLLRVWTPQGVDADGATTYRQTATVMGLSDSYLTEPMGQAQFTVTAIVDPGGFDAQNAFVWPPCFTALQEQPPAGGLWCAYFTVDPLGPQLHDLLGDLRAWQASLPADAGATGTVDLNRMLLLYHGMDYPGGLLLLAFYGLLAVVLGVILVGAVSLARNAFAISMAERTQMLGMLASVGATRAQKRQSVLYEAAVLALLGIPLGLALGCGGMAAALGLLSRPVQELFAFTEPLYLSVRPLPLVAAALLAALTLAFSALRPARQASRVSPMEAIRGEGQVQFRASDVKTGKLTERLFGFPGVLALKNCKRNRKRYRAIVFSLALSVVMLLAGSGLSYYVDRAMGVRYGADSPVATATITYNDPAADGAAYAADLKALGGTGEARLIGGLPMGAMSDFVLEGAEPVTVCPALLVLEDELFASWVGQEIALDPAYLDCVIATDFYHKESRLTRRNTPLALQPGFTMAFAQENGFADTWRVAALAEAVPYSGGEAANTADGLTLQLVTSRSVFEEFLNRQVAQNRSGDYYWQVQYIHPENTAALTESLQTWSMNHRNGLPQGATSATYGTFAMGGLQRFGMLLQVFCTGFVLLLCLICMANIHNVLSTGIELRAREYAVLRSIGLTPGDLRNMIRLESLFYGIKGLCWGLPFGLGALALEYATIRLAFPMPFCLPVGSITLAVTLVLGICALSGLLTHRCLGNGVH